MFNYPLPSATPDSLRCDPWAAPDQPDYDEEDDYDDEASSWADLYNDDDRIADRFGD